MKRVVYLIEQPLDERNFRRFGIQAWIDRQWQVEVWDLTPWAHRRVWADFNHRGHDLKRFAGYFPIHGWKDLKGRLRGAATIRCFVDLTGTGFQSVRAKSALRRMGAKRIVCAVGTLPVPDRDGTSLASKLGKALSKGPVGAWKRLSTAFFTRVVAPRIPAELAVISGTESMTLTRLRGEVIRAHNFDYDIYLELKASVTPKISDAGLVFIDQDYCFHLEFTYLGTPPVVTAERYFPAVCDALEAISASLGMHVRIAAHPRASYEQRGKERFFRAFPIECGRTAEMINECKAVVCHDSTAIQYAVLFEKPAVFITTDELSRAYEGKSVERVADELGKKPINVDRVDVRTVDWQKELAIDRDKYARYRNKYIKIEGSPDRPLWTIVIDRAET
jgi:hypothetical protein